MSGIRRAFVIAIVTCGSLLAGCGESPSEAPAVPKANDGKKVPKVAGLPPEMVSAVAAGQSASVISVHFALGKLPVAGQALPVNIAIVPHQDFTSVRANFAGVEGLAVTVGNSMEPVANVKLETVLSHQLVLLPAKDGVFMISGTVETESPTDGTVSRVFSLPMIVAADANPVPAPAAPAQTAP